MIFWTMIGLFNVSTFMISTTEIYHQSKYSSAKNEVTSQTIVSKLQNSKSQSCTKDKRTNLYIMCKRIYFKLNYKGAL